MKSVQFEEEQVDQKQREEQQRLSSPMTPSTEDDEDSEFWLDVFLTGLGHAFFMVFAVVVSYMIFGDRFVRLLVAPEQYGKWSLILFAAMSGFVIGAFKEIVPALALHSKTSSGDGDEDSEFWLDVFLTGIGHAFFMVFAVVVSYMVFGDRFVRLLFAPEHYGKWSLILFGAMSGFVIGAFKEIVPALAVSSKTKTTITSPPVPVPVKVANGEGETKVANGEGETPKTKRTLKGTVTSMIGKSKVDRRKSKIPGALLLKSIHAGLLSLPDNYDPPVFPKEEDEQNFIRAALQRNFVFSNLNQKEMDTMVAAFKKVEVDKETIILSEGGKNDFCLLHNYCYVLKQGKVAFQNNGVTVGGTDEKGTLFGELALLYSAPNSATIISETSCQLYRVDQRTFRFIMQTQTAHTENDKKDLVRGLTFLKDLDDQDLDKLAATMAPRPFDVGEYLVKKGEQGDAFYIIQEGKVTVTDIEIGSTKYEDQHLRAGDYFGERALVTNEPRSANCIGVTKGIVLFIDRETFVTAIGSLSRLILKSADKRVLSAIKVIKDTHLDSTDLASLAAVITDQKYKAGDVIIEMGSKTPAALYLVREGKVEVTSKRDESVEEVKSGGAFGEAMLKADYCNGGKGDTLVTAKISVKAIEDTVLGVLTLEECRAIIDTTILGRRQKTNFTSIIETSIKMSDLKKHTMLGAGTFGRVWLVSKEARDGSRRPYALKIQSKYVLVQNSQAKGVVQEKNIMARLQHPFIIQLVQTYKDAEFLYMLLGLVQGGELSNVLYTDMRDGLPEANALFYAAGIMDGFSYMHRRKILYRDLKPENVLINHQGYPVIVDMGFAKYVTSKTFTLCGTPLYIAPEVILNHGHDMGADHWSLGVLIYEMVAGETPFYKNGMDQITVFGSIVKGEYDFPPGDLMSADVKDLCNRLLVTNPYQRIGSLAGGEKDMFGHAWFKDIDFGKLRRMEIKAPWVPSITNPLDATNFDEWDDLESDEETPLLSEEEAKIFQTF